jgi:micrococcal nuclease
MIMKPLIALLILNFAFITGYAEEEIKGTVSSVIDGNTIEILASNNEIYKVLLHGVDCPETGQNYGEQAKAFLEKLLLHKSITILLRGKDRWGNRLGDIKVDGIPDPERELIRVGLAWTTEPNPELETLKDRARAQGLGLWSEENPMPPWMYRRQQTMLQPKSS